MAARSKVPTDTLLWIDLAAPEYAPGNLVMGSVELDLAQDVKVKGFSARIVGTERTAVLDTSPTKALLRGNWGESRVLDQKIYRDECVTLELPLSPARAPDPNRKIGSNRGPGELPAGSYRFPFESRLPATIPPSMEGGYFSMARIDYRAEAFLQLHWRADMSAEEPFRVSWPPRPGAGGPRAFSSGPLERTQGLRVQGNLDSTVVQRGGQITGAIKVENPEGAKVRGAHVQLQLMGWARALDHPGDAEPARMTGDFLRGDALDRGEAVEFRIDVPPGVVPTFNGRMCGIAYYVRVTLDVSLGFDFATGSEIVIM